MKHKKIVPLLALILTVGVVAPVSFSNVNLTDTGSYLSRAEAKKVSRKTHLRRYNYLISLGITESFIKQYTTKRLKASDVKSIVDLWNGEESDSNVKVYNFTLTCDSSNPEAGADKSIVSNESDQDEFSFYKKFAFSEIKLASMPKMQLYEKNNFYSGMDEESWSKSNASFYTEGYLWLYYGYKDNGYTECNMDGTGDYRLFIYE